MTMREISSERIPETQSTQAAKPAISNGRLWAGRIMSGLPAVFLLMDGVMKLVKPAPVVEATTQLGYPEAVIVPIGLVLLASTLLYLVPRTAILGAILLTGYLGGAVASKVRVQADLFNITFPVILGVLLWGGLWLRDRKMREELPVRAL